MKTLLCLCLASLLSGCLPIGIRGQNLPFTDQTSTPVQVTPISSRSALKLLCATASPLSP